MEVACTAKRNFDRECKKTFATKSAHSCPQPTRRDVRSWWKRTLERRTGKAEFDPSATFAGVKCRSAACSRVSYRMGGSVGAGTNSFIAPGKKPRRKLHVRREKAGVHR